MSPDAFARRPDAREALDPKAFDHTLLSAAIFHETNGRRTQTGRPRWGTTRDSTGRPGCRRTSWPNATC